MIYTTVAAWDFGAKPGGTLTYDGLMAALRKIQREIGGPISVGAVRVVASPYHPRREIGASLSYMPPIVRQPRSKRLWKKLCKRRRRMARPLTEPDDPIMMGGVLYCSLEHKLALMEQAA